MSKKSIFAVLVVFFSLLSVTEVGVTSNVVTEDSLATVKLSREDSVAMLNDTLFVAFLESLSYIESRGTANISSTRNADGQRSCGWVQITPIFVKQANINKSLSEGTGTHQRPKRYYKLKDAHSFEKSKEMVYWVNKRLFDEYDNNGKVYDHKLWHKILLVHNPNAPSKYRKRIMALYNKKISDLQLLD